MPKRLKFFFVLCLSALLEVGLCSASSFTWTGAVSSDWFNQNNWSPVGVPGLNDSVNFNSGSINLSAPVTFGGQFNWAGGSLAGNPLSITTNGALNIEGSVSLQGVLTNQGTVNWQAGTLSVYSNIWNQAGGMWNVQCDQAMNNSTGTSQFNNAGGLLKTAGSNTTTINVSFANSGTAVAQSGTIKYGNATLGGSFQAATNAAIYFSGLCSVNGPVSFQGPGVVQITTNSSLAGIFSGTVNWSGGQIAGGSSLTVATNGVLNIQGNVTVAGTGYALTNYGTVNWQAGTVVLINSSILNETNGAWIIQCDQAMNPYYGIEEFANAGLLRKSAGTNTTTIDVALENSGLVDVEEGTIQFDAGGNLAGTLQAATNSILSFANGSFVENGPLSIQGQGQVEVAGGNLTLSNALSGTLNWYSGKITGRSVISNVMNWYGGNISSGSSLTVSSNGVLNIEGSVTVAGVLTNLGTVNWQAGTVLIQNSDIFNQTNGVWNIQCDQSMNDYYGDEFFVNAGLLNKTTTSNTTSFNVPFNNSGTVEAQSGTINCGNIDLGGSFQAASNTAIYFFGSCSVNGPVDFQGPGVVQVTTNSTLSGIFSGTLNWSGGQITNSLTVATNGVLNIQGNVTVAGPYYALTNFGTVNWQAGTILLRNSSILNETNGAWIIQCDQSMNPYYGIEEFANAGVLRKSAGTNTTTIDVALENTGLVDVEEGTIQFYAGGNLAGTLQAVTNSFLSLAGGSFVENGPLSIQGQGQVEVAGGNLTSSNALSGTLNWYSGNITGQSVISNVLNWYGGKIGSGNSLTIASNGVLNIEGNVTLEGVLTNFGTVNWQAGTVLIQNTGIVNQTNGVWNIRCDQAMNPYYGDEAFVNAGLLNKMAGSNTTTIGVAFDNSGSVNVEEGTIQSYAGGNLGGIYQAASNAAIYFSGSCSVNGPVSFQGPGMVQVTTNSILAGIFSGTLNWSGGQITNSLTVATNGVLNIQGNVTVAGPYYALTNFGTVNWQAGTILLRNSSILNETNGAWIIQCDQSMNPYYGIEEFANAGVLRKIAGTNTTTIDVALENTGLVDVEEGTIQFYAGGNLAGTLQAVTNSFLSLAGGSFVENGPLSIQGQGQVEVAGGNLTSSNALSGTLNWYSGNITGQSVISNVLNWYGGKIGSGNSLTIASNGVLNIEGNVTLEGVLTNFGTVNWQAGTVLIQNTGIVNQTNGVWNIRCDQAMNPYYGDEAFVNAGLLNKMAGSNTTTIGVAFDNSGSVNVEEGTIQSYAGGNLGGIYQAASNAAIYFSGSCSVNGPVSFQGPGMVQVTTNSILAGIFSGTLNWSGGQITNSLTVATNGVLNIQGNVTVAGPYYALTNFGTVNWQAGTILLRNSSILNETNGAWIIQCDQSMNPYYGIEEFANAGLLRKIAGTNTTTIDVALENTGLVDVEEGMIQFYAGGNLAGTFQAETNSVIYFANGSFNFSGTIQGPGIVSFGNIHSTLPINLMTAQNENSVIQINPTNQIGVFSWEVDGVDQLFQKWFWLREGSNNSQVSFDTLGTLLPGSSGSNIATVTYLAQALYASLNFTLNGGSPGSHSSDLIEHITIHNTTNIPIGLHLFEYSDFDLAGEAAGDTVSFPSAGTVEQQGKGMTITETAQAPPPSFWEASWYSITLDELTGSAPLTLSDEIIPEGAGDQTFTYQWDMTLGAGQTFVLSLTNSIRPVSVQLSIALSNANAVISWPTNSAASYQLQGTTALGAPSTWTTITNLPTVLGGQYRVTVPCAEAAMFYRLLQ